MFEKEGIMNHLLQIDKQKVINNIELCKGDKEVCLMVKADTYGLGDDALDLLIDLGYKFFGVSTLEEGLKLRSKSDDIKILLVSYLDVDNIDIAIQNNITITVYDFLTLEALNDEACFHIKVDTNMGRLGFQLDELETVADYLSRNELYPEGIFSHLACASDRVKTEKAIKNFEYALDIFSDFNFKYIHLLNSYGSLNYDTEFDNLVRIGIAIWGYLANAEEARMSRKKLEPALSLSLTISHVKEYDGFLSYDHLDNVHGTVYTSPLGYHDGFSRKMRGYHIPNVGTIVGNVNMCQHLILSDDTVNYKRGDLYPLFCEEELYNICQYGKITTYEFLVSLSDRIKRVVH